MKTVIKKSSISFMVAFIAIAGAFASNLSDKEAFLADQEGRYLNENQECVLSNITCSTVFHTEMCSDSTLGVLYDWNGTICTTPLYYKP